MLKQAVLTAISLIAGAYFQGGAASATVCFGGDLGPGSCFTSGEQKVFLQSGTSSAGSGNVGSQTGPSLVDFSSTSTLTFADGFATIKPASGKSFNDFKVTTPGYTFTDLIFGAQFTKSSGPLDFTLSAFSGGTLAGTETYTSPTLTHNADLTFELVSTSPLTQVEFASASGFNQLKQFEVSGLAPISNGGGGGGVGGVPEASTWAMMLIGFAGLGMAGYRSRRSAARAV